ncbi:MAG: hypothetical protein DMG21_08600 [Acidobacteria bacterium]|nr:MAG: hypothetical protein DMG21_08600 [Acidobacteriota bacterium]
MSVELSDEKQQAHQLIDRLEPGQLRALISLVQFMLLDATSRALATAPLDDEDETEDERRAVAKSKSWFEKRNGQGIPHEKVLSEFGLTPDDIKDRK